MQVIYVGTWKFSSSKSFHHSNMLNLGAEQEKSKNKDKIKILVFFLFFPFLLRLPINAQNATGRVIIM